MPFYRPLLPLALACACLVVPPAPAAWAHGATHAQHGGMVQMNGETLFELVRAPALGLSPAALSWQVTGGLAVVLPLIAYTMYLRYRHRIIFWI